MTDLERVEGVDLVLALIEQGDLAKAGVFCEGLRARAPDHPVTHFLSGAVAIKDGRFADAVRALETAYALDPGDSVCRDVLEQARISLAWRLHGQGQIEAARAEIAAAAVARPDGSFAVMRATMCLEVIPDSRGAMELARCAYETEVRALIQLAALIDPRRVVQAGTNFRATYQGIDDRPFQEVIAEFYRRNCAALSFRAAHVDERPAAPPVGRVSVGFVSAYFRNHTVGKLYRGLIERLDRNAFHVTVFFVGAPADEMGRAISAAADRVVVLPHALEAAQTAVAGARLDVLVYPEIGMDPLTYFLAFARLARVQLVGWGHPSTSGIAAIDYFLSSDDLEEAGDAAQRHYCERLHRLSVTPAYLYRPPATSEMDTPDLSFAQGRTLYCCPQSLFKVHPDFDELLFGVLARDRGGVALFIEGTHGWSDRLRARWRLGERGLVDRVVFLPRLPQPAFLALLAAADVVLDTIHFSGGISTVEALAQGTPVVTWPNTPLMCGRVSAAYYRQMGITDCIAQSAEDYIGRAVRLGTDPVYRRGLRDRILANLDRLFCRQEAVDELQQFFVKAARR